MRNEKTQALLIAPTKEIQIYFSKSLNKIFGDTLNKALKHNKAVLPTRYKFFIGRF